MITKHRLILSFSLFLWVLVGFAQKNINTSNDSINRLDNQKLKQGKWVFTDAMKSPLIICSFKNDTIVGKRIFIIDSTTIMIRDQRQVSKERFILLKNGEKYRGWFDSKGNISFENPADSVKSDSSIQYLAAVPPVYAFGNKNLGEDIDEILKPYKKELKGNKLVIEILISKSGIVETIDLKLEKNNQKLETKIKNSLKQLDRWQPAFNGWKTEPYKKQVIINY